MITGRGPRTDVDTEPGAPYWRPSGLVVCKKGDFYARRCYGWKW